MGRRQGQIMLRKFCTFPRGWKGLPVCSCLIVLGIWFLVAYVGIDSHNVHDLLINQELNRVREMDLSSSLRHPFRSQGLRRMRESNVTFVGVGKDIAGKLPSVLRQIGELAPFFGASRAIFAQGDSKDGTQALLESWAQESKGNRTILRTSSLLEKETSGHFVGQPMPREGRIAKARNVALEALFGGAGGAGGGGAATEFVIVVDLDILGWDPNGVADSFGRPGWDVMCAHGILLHGIYRDTYAFRSEGIDTNHHWAGKDHALYNISDTDYTVRRARLKVAQKRAREVMDAAAPVQAEFRPLQVRSCFGGLAIYKSAQLQSCRYAYRHAEPPFMLDCEHVLLHECLAARGANIYSNFNMKLWYGHSQVSTLSLKKVVSSLSPF